MQGRIADRKIKVNGIEVYNELLQYVAGTNRTTTIPSIIGYKGGSTIAYSYDSRGNITSITYGSNKKINYTYDKYGRLTSEENVTVATTIAYAYDNYGNIISKKLTQKVGDLNLAQESKYYAYTNGRLTSFNGQSCTYDAIGNPTKYCGYTMTWTRGGKLTGYKNSSFTYDGLGRRASKTVSGTTVTYTYDSEDRLIKSSDGMEYYYDGTGVIAFKYNGALYLYKKDIQGNINAIVDSNGNEVVQYDYDAWGSHTVSGNTTLGNLNPFRYRGYFYDADTGLYYLETRYYDPEVGRFISPDSVQYATPEAVNGLNLYAYCNNNPVMGYDPTGTTQWWEWLAFAVASVVVIGAAIVATVATGGAALVAGGIAIGGALGGLGSIAVQGVTNGWDNISVGGIAAGMMLGSALGSPGGIGAGALGAGGVGASAGALALAGGGTVSVGETVAGVGLLALNVWLAKWVPGSWPGDDPTVPPGDGFIWRGPGKVGSEFGEWYNPSTHDQLHPDLQHPLPKGPHWGWKNKLLRILIDIFKLG